MPLTIKLSIAKVKVQIEQQTDPILSVDDLVAYIQQVGRQLLTHWVRRQQEQRLQQLLGESWRHKADKDIGIGCPECGSIALRRKCWRKRQLTVDYLGKVPVARRQLRCLDCGRCWMPFADALQLPSGAYGQNKLSRAIDRVTDQSYAKAAQADPDGPSASTLHRCIRGLSCPDVTGPVGTAVSDGTRIPGWKSTDQISVSLAHEIGPSKRDGCAQRPDPRDRRVLGVSAGREPDIIGHLTGLNMQALVHDGRLKLGDQARYVGRCRWHVPHTVRYLLYRDDIKGEDNTARVKQLKQGLHAYRTNPKALSRSLAGWVADNEDAPVACRHVEISSPALETMAAHPDEFTTHTTSHLEREMVEVNKRFENGGGWTRRGAQNLLWLHQLNRHEPEKYQHVKQQLITQTVFPN